MFIKGKKKTITQPEIYLECQELEFWNHHFRRNFINGRRVKFTAMFVEIPSQ